MPHYKQACQIALRLLLRPLHIKRRLLLHALRIKLRELRSLAIGSASWLAIDSACWHCRICCVLMVRPLYLISNIVKTIRQRTLLFDISAKEATEQGPSPPAQRHVVPEGQALVYITEASQA